MDQLLTPRDKIVQKLTPTVGEELEIMCNLTSPKQMDVFVQEVGYTALGSSYIITRTNMYKRLTCSFNGKARNDLVEIGKTPEYRGTQPTGYTDR